MNDELSESSPSTESTLHSIEALLSIVATEVDEFGHAFLFAGEHLALDLPIVPAAGKKMKWGVAAHHDWAFEATLVRFARSNESARLLIVSGHGEDQKVVAWVLGHSMASFWAARMPQPDAKLMFARVPR
jgi:hypothetical protein